jgi:SagB-type dehydrogenase family enzyme
VKESYTPAYFFFLHGDKLVAYNLKTHKYFEVDDASFSQLKKLSSKEMVTQEDFNLFQDIQFDEPELEVCWDGDLPSHILHQASRLFARDNPQLSEAAFVTQYADLSNKITDIPEKDRGQGKKITLPEPALDIFDQVSLGFCFRERKTCREFINRNIEISEVSNILYSCFAPIHGQKRDELSHLGIKDFGYRRSSPSSTGLASCDAILWVNNVQGLESGLYSYNERDHQLIKLSQSMTNQELIYGMMDQFWLENLACGIFIVNDMRTIWLKDRLSRGYLASHQECGHLSQNVLLSATALKLQTWISGTFRDDFLQERLELPSYRFVSLFIGIGHGTNQAISQKYMNLLEKT